MWIKHLAYWLACGRLNIIISYFCYALLWKEISSQLAEVIPIAQIIALFTSLPCFSYAPKLLNSKHSVP